MRYSNALALTALCTTLALLSCSKQGGTTIRHTIKERRPFPLGASFEVFNTNGEVDIKGIENSKALVIDHEKVSTAGTYREAAGLRDRSKAKVETSKKKVKLVIEDPPLAQDQQMQHNIRITVPFGTTVVVHQANGSVSIKHVKGDVTVLNDNGDVEVDDVQGFVQVDGNNGKISVTGLSGGTSIKASNGKVRLDAPGLDCSKPCSIFLANGNINATLPEESGIHLAASVGNGSIDNELKLNDLKEQSRTKLDGTLGKAGKGRLEMRVGNGKIKLIKRYTKD